MLFIISLFGVFTLMFLIIMSFANVFIEKQKASSNAEMASLTASAILLEHLDMAIEEYDEYLLAKYLEALSSAVEEAGEVVKILEPEYLREKVEDEIANLPSFLKDSEKKHKAINTVLKAELPGNAELKGFVNANLDEAKEEIIQAVQNNIQMNKGQLSETKIVFNSQNRLEVETATRYEAMKFDEYFSESSRHVRQSGQGPSFVFNESLGWSMPEISF